MTDGTGRDELQYMHTVRDDTGSPLKSAGCHENHNVNTLSGYHGNEAHTPSKSQNNAMPTSSDITSQKKATDKGKAPAKKTQGFMDVLNEILEENPYIPSTGKIGPKPWLRKQNLPKPKNKYEVSQEPFVFRPKSIPPGHSQESPEPRSTKNESAPTTSGQTDFPLLNSSGALDLYARPPSRGRNSNPQIDNGANNIEKSSKNSSEADTGFGSNASSNQSTSSSRLPSREEVSKNTDYYKIAFVTYPSAATSPSRSVRANSPLHHAEENDPQQKAESAQDLARAALQALSLSKNILQDMESDRGSVASYCRDSSYGDALYSRAGSVQQELYDVPQQHDVTKNDSNNNNRTVISVPTFKPPPAPLRNDKDHPMSSEPIYDISRSSTQTPTTVSRGALDLMYQLFGKDLTGNNALHAQYERPDSLRSVGFNSENKSQGEMYSARPPSRPASVCSEWSDCTLNFSEYPESETTTLPTTTTIDFPSIPQVGLPTHLPNNSLRPPHPNDNFIPHSLPGQPLPMAPNAPYNNNSYPQSHPRLPIPNGGFPPRHPAPFPQTGIPIPQPHQHRFPLQNSPRSHWPSHGAPHHEMEPPRPPQHAFSPPHSRWNGFSPPRHYDTHSRNCHPTNHPPQRRGRERMRGTPHRRVHSHSRSRRRPPSYSDDETCYSYSPSPVRHPHRHRPHDSDDVMLGRDAIIGKSYIDGYKAAMKDAVKTFTENQALRLLKPKETKEEKMHRALRRAISSGRINKLPDNVELGDIRKAFSNKQSDNEYEDNVFDDDIGDVIDDVDNFILPTSGRPSSKTSRSHSRGRVPYRDNDVIDDVRYSYDSDHSESCDCSDCEEDFEMRNSFHEGELRRKPVPRRNVRSQDDEGRRRKEDSEADVKMTKMRQTYMDSLEVSGRRRNPNSLNHRQGNLNDFELRNQRAAERRNQNFEHVNPRVHGNANLNFHGHPRFPPPPQQRREWERSKKVQFGY